MQPVRGNGFTLVELLVVIALMAVIAGSVVLTMGAPGNGASDSATRFASRLAAARDESILTGRPISAWVSRSGYGFDQYRDGHWEKLTRKPFDGADWGRGTQVSFEGAQEARARLRFDSLGMPDQPLTVQISSDGRKASVRVEASGDVTVE